ncbi:MAG: DUF1254 domain-containing protein [Pseudomonadota bacterium]
MNKWVIALVMFVGCAVIAHWWTVRAIPGFVMSRAMDTMEERGLPLHGFALAPLATPQSQTVVRPSPDLSYSICRFHIPDDYGGLFVSAAPFDGYGSISFFDARTNNFATVRTRSDAPTPFTIVGPRHVDAVDLSSDVPDRTGLVAPTRQGLVLIRRLTATAAARDRVEAIAKDDVCQLLPYNADLLPS